MEITEITKTQITETETVKKRGRPRIHFEEKIKGNRGRPVGSVSQVVLNRTKEEISEIRKIRAQKYFESKPEQVVKAKESYKRYYDRNKVEINERRMVRKHGIQTKENKS
jgi:hypothetical protein